jgi:HEAT repeat protein
MQEKLPLFLPASHLNLPVENSEDPLITLVEAVSQMVSNVTYDNLSKYMDRIFSEGQAILLLDGLEEIHPEDFQHAVDYLKLFINQYPAVRVITTASNEYYDGLLGLAFTPLPVASWNKLEREKFIQKWSNLWVKFIDTQDDKPDKVDPILLNAWLLNDSATFTPLELTLKVWAAYAGDALGPKPIDGLESYIRRMSFDETGTRTNLEIIALHSLVNQKLIFSQNEAKDWSRTISTDHTTKPGVEDETTVEPEEATIESSDPGRVNIPDMLNRMGTSGLMVSFGESQYRFSHQTIANYLAGWAPDFGNVKEQILNLPHYGSRAQFLGYSTNCGNSTSIMQSYLDRSQYPLQRELLHAGLWLRDASEDASWVNQVMRQLAEILQSDTHALTLRAQAASALATSRHAGVGVLFRQLLKADSPELRHLAALCSGQIADVKAVNDLNTLMGDPTLNVRRAAFLALVAIGNEAALNLVAEALLHGKEDIQQLAAEALANDPEEGHTMLKEGCTIDDLLVRRAVVFGLQRIQERWAIELLSKLQLEEEQWVVRTAATEALAFLDQPDPHIPRRPQPLTETPWLITFAGDRGIGVAPGKPALDLLVLALKEGNEEEQLAALNALKYQGASSAILAIYDALYSEQGEVREVAFDTLWHIAATDTDLPPPAKYELGT